MMANRTVAVPAILFAALLLAGCRAGIETEPEKRLAAGWVRFSQGEHSLAQAEFDAAVKSLPPESPLRAESLYALATVWNLRRPGNDRERAARLYRETIAADPDGEWAAWSLLALARMRLTAPEAMAEGADLEALRKDYQEVIDRFPRHEAGEQAFLFLQATRLEQSRSDEETRKTEARAVLESLDAFLKERPETPYRSAILGFQGHCYSVLEMWERQLETIMEGWRTAPVDPLNPVRDLAGSYWWVATMAAFETGDWDTAREYLEKLIAEYPTDMRIFLAKQVLRRMGELEARLRAELEQGEARP